jgi:tetratricopeptide (TPR) repeat protein
MDACAPMPITEIAEASARIEDGAAAFAPTWSRAYDYALGLSHGVGDFDAEALAAAERALAIAQAPRDRATVMQLLADLAAKLGRTDDAIAWTARAEELIGPHAALARARGGALAGVFRYRDALPWLRATAEGAPRDHRAWAELALAASTADDARAALLASSQGLLLQPRDPDMLRVQALALERLGAPSDAVDRARAAFLAFRAPDDAPRLKSACARTVPGCALERLPVHVHALRAVARPVSR